MRQANGNLHIVACDNLQLLSTKSAYSVFSGIFIFNKIIHHTASETAVIVCEKNIWHLRFFQSHQHSLRETFPTPSALFFSVSSIRSWTSNSQGCLTCKLPTVLGALHASSQERSLCILRSIVDTLFAKVGFAHNSVSLSLSQMQMLQVNLKAMIFIGRKNCMSETVVRYYRKDCRQTLKTRWSYLLSSEEFEQLTNMIWHWEEDLLPEVFF